jgi:hypothetical protein
MKLRALVIDQNQRSMLTETEIPLFKVSETEWASDRQEAKGWSIAIRQPGEPLPGGPTEMHLTNFPSIVMCMQGHLQTTGQDGKTCRLAVGEGICLDGRALHHSTFGPGGEAIVMLNLTLNGTGGFDFG